MADSTIGNERVATRSARMIPAFESARPPVSRAVEAWSALLLSFFDMAADVALGADLRFRDVLLEFWKLLCC